jgi:hypothetical protein
MTDAPEDETPIQRALRLKKAAAEARPAPPRGKGARKASAALPHGQSKPWLKR